MNDSKELTLFIIAIILGITGIYYLYPYAKEIYEVIKNISWWMLGIIILLVYVAISSLYEKIME